jgi:CRP-like cAMP-binding protein
MGQYFILDGVLKRVVSDKAAKEMILRFASEREIETSYAAWRLGTPTPYSIVAVTKARVAKLPLPDWVAFMDRHPQIKQGFEYEVMQLMSEIMAHTITLHLLDAPAGCTASCASTPSCSTGCRRRSSPPTSTSRPRR